MSPPKATGAVPPRSQLWTELLKNNISALENHANLLSAFLTTLPTPSPQHLEISGLLALATNGLQQARRSLEISDATQSNPILTPVPNTGKQPNGTTASPASSASKRKATQASLASDQINSSSKRQKYRKMADIATSAKSTPRTNAATPTPKAQGPATTPASKAKGPATTPSSKVKDLATTPGSKPNGPATTPSFKSKTALPSADDASATKASVSESKTTTTTTGTSPHTAWSGTALDAEALPEIATLNIEAEVEARMTASKEKRLNKRQRKAAQKASGGINGILPVLDDMEQTPSNLGKRKRIRTSGESQSSAPTTPRTNGVAQSGAEARPEKAAEGEQPLKKKRRRASGRGSKVNAPAASPAAKGTTNGLNGDQASVKRGPDTTNEGDKMPEQNDRPRKRRRGGA